MFSKHENASIVVDNSQLLVVSTGFLLLLSCIVIWTRRKRNMKPRVAIDVSYGSKHMNRNELNSLRKQVTFCYSLSRKHQCKVYITSFEGEKSLYRVCYLTFFLSLSLSLSKTTPPSKQVHVLNHQNWDKEVIEFTKESVAELKGDWNSVVYLSPDSENILDDVRGDTLYVIGGIVDKTVQKNISLNRAREMNITTSRLPVQEYLRCHGMGRSIKTELNVDKVYDALLRRGRGEIWNDIFDAVLPQRRKGKSYHKINKSEIDTNMHIDFTEEQIKQMSKREILRYNFKAWLLDSLFKSDNMNVSFQTNFNTSINVLDRERWCSIVNVKNAAGVILYSERGYSYSKKSAESVASWYVLRHQPDFFLEHYKKLKGRKKRATKNKQRSKTPAPRKKSSKSSHQHILYGES